MTVTKDYGADVHFLQLEGRGCDSPPTATFVIATLLDAAGNVVAETSDTPQAGHWAGLLNVTAVAPGPYKVHASCLLPFAQGRELFVYPDRTWTVTST